jgi:hypothetical protein
LLLKFKIIYNSTVPEMAKPMLLPNADSSAGGFPLDADDTPKRFKEMMNPQVKDTQKDKAAVALENKADEAWVVRPGETFREFNARVKGLGLTVPPGVSESYRLDRNGRRYSSIPSIKKIEETLHKKEKTAVAKLDSENPFRARKKTGPKLKKKAQNGIRLSPGGKLKHSSDCAAEPPTLEIKPKATLKMPKKQSGAKNPSLLPLIRRQ